MKMGEKGSELLRPRPQAASDSEEMFKTQTRTGAAAVGAHAEIKAHKYTGRNQSVSTASQSRHRTQPSVASGNTPAQRRNPEVWRKNKLYTESKVLGLVCPVVMSTSCQARAQGP